LMDWPLVVANDDGIRPAGPQDACLYCKRRIGQEHGRDCVVVTKRVRLLAGVDTAAGLVVGSWEADEPHGWDVERILYRYNDGCWCADNLLDDVKDWKTGAQARGLYVPGLLLEVMKRDGCLCEATTVHYGGLVDPGPKRDVREGSP
jgi:hypothetical protein